MSDHLLPKDKNKPFTVNGIKFANRAEYNLRVKEDATKMAELLYDIYQDKKAKEKMSHNNDSATPTNRGSDK